MVDHGEQQDHVSLLFEAREQCGGLGVLPAGGGGGAGEIGVQGEDVELFGHAALEDALGGGGVALERDDARAERGGECAELAGVGADVQHAGGAQLLDRGANEGELGCGLLRGVVGERGGVAGPLRCGGPRRGAARAAAQRSECAAQDVEGEAGVLGWCGGCGLTGAALFQQRGQRNRNERRA
jgi:hypothetical protein